MKAAESRAERFSVSLPAGMLRELREEAGSKGVSLSALIKSIAEEHKALRIEIENWMNYESEHSQGGNENGKID